MSLFSTYAQSTGAAAGFPQPVTALSAEEKNIIVMDGKIRVRIAVKDILFIQAEHVYVRIYVRNQQRILQRMSLSAILDQLPQEKFVQVHRSFIVNLQCVDAWARNSLSIDGHDIPISRNRYQTVRQRLHHA